MLEGKSHSTHHGDCVSQTILPDEGSWLGEARGFV